MNETVRMPKFVLWLAIAVSLTVTLAYVGAVFVSGPPPAFELPSQIEIVALSIMFVLFGLLLPGYLIAAYLRDALFLAGTTLTVRGLFGEQRIDLTRVTYVRWHPYDAGLIIVTVDRRKLGIPFSDFRPPAEFRLALIRRLRETIPVEDQEGWELFCLRCVVRLINPHFRGSEHSVFVTRADVARRFLKLFALSIPVALGLSLLLENYWWMLSPLIVIPGGFLAVYAVPAEGIWADSLDNAEFRDGCGTMVLFVFFMTAAMIASIKFLEPLIGWAWSTLCWLVPSLLLGVYACWRFCEKQGQFIKNRLSEAIPKALAEWEAYLSKAKREGSL